MERNGRVILTAVASKLSPQSVKKIVRLYKTSPKCWRACCPTVFFKEARALFAQNEARFLVPKPFEYKFLAA